MNGPHAGGWDPARLGTVPAMPVTTHAYGDHPHQFGELSLPEGTDATSSPLPVAILVHGGFWMAEVGLARMQALAADLAARGWAAWNVEYRRLGAGSDGRWPLTPQDVSAAVDHVQVLAVDVPLDLTRVVTIGHSAGAHLVLLDAAQRGDDSAVALAATVGQAPLTDVVHAYSLGQGIDIIEAFMGGGPAERADEYAAASPVTRVPLGVRQLIVQGEQDEMVPPAMVKTYVAAALAAGDDVTFDLRPDDGHFELIEPDSGGWATVLTWLEAQVA